MDSSSNRRLTRRELLQYCARAALACPAMGIAIAMSACSGGSSAPPPPALSDDAFLDQVQRAIFLFFWEQASATTGQVKDRALAAGNDTRTVSSIAATGFGLTALCIGHQRGYGDAAQIQSRVTATLSFLLDQLPNVNGFFYHFIDMETGARALNSEVSSIDTSILLCGVLTCRRYFQDAQIQSLASQIYARVNWPWMLAGGSLAFLPADCLAVLRNTQRQYPRAWQRYGFVDAFNPLAGWFDTDVIGIDAGITMLMAENQRTGFVWSTFMANTEAQNAFSAVGLQ